MSRASPPAGSASPPMSSAASWPRWPASIVAARIGSGDPQAGTNFTLLSITAVVLGGTSVFGGRGTALGTLVGALLIMLIQNALNQLARLGLLAIRLDRRHADPGRGRHLRRPGQIRLRLDPGRSGGRGGCGSRRKHDERSRSNASSTARNKLGEVPVWDVGGAGALLGRHRGQAAAALHPGDRRGASAGRCRSASAASRSARTAGSSSPSPRASPSTISTPARSNGSPGPTRDPRNRFNEGKCDRRGRFWAGTMDDRLSEHSASLFRVDPDLLGASHAAARSASPIASSGRSTNDASISPTRMDRRDLSLRLRSRGRPHRQPQPLRRTSARVAVDRTAAPSTRKASSGTRSGTAGASSATRRTDASTGSSSCRCRSRRAACSAARTSRPSTSPRRSGI